MGEFLEDIDERATEHCEKRSETREGEECAVESASVESGVL
jgi:hypothetical protein